MSQNGANSQALKWTFSQELKTKGQSENTDGHPCTTVLSGNSSASKNTSKRYTKKELHDCKAGVTATGNVGVLKPLIQIGSLPWNPLVGEIISKSEKNDE